MSFPKNIPDHATLMLKNLIVSHCLSRSPNPDCPWHSPGWTLCLWRHWLSMHLMSSESNPGSFDEGTPWTNVWEPSARTKRQNIQTLSRLVLACLSTSIHLLSSSWSFYLHILQVLHPWFHSHLPSVTPGDGSGTVGSSFCSILKHSASTTFDTFLLLSLWEFIKHGVLE